MVHRVGLQLVEQPSTTFSVLALRHCHMVAWYRL